MAVRPGVSYCMVVVISDSNSERDLYLPFDNFYGDEGYFTHLFPRWI